MPVIDNSDTHFVYQLTENNLEKSICEASGVVKRLFSSWGLHDYSTTPQGEIKRYDVVVVGGQAGTASKISCYHPKADHDERFWILGLKTHFPAIKASDLVEVRWEDNSVVISLESEETHDGLIVEFIDVLEQIDNLDQLDKLSHTKRRAEQRLIRQFLFGGSTNGECSICGRELPNRLMVAAHIKKRSHCSEEEKRDVGCNVIPLCSLGCDALFETGLIVVNNGTYHLTFSKEDYPDLFEAFSRIDGMECLSYDSGAARYFDYHLKLHTGSSNF